MVTLTLPSDIVIRLEQALRRSVRCEIGGILMAEHIGVNEFVIRDITIHRRGTFASFIRLIEDAWATLSRFFEKTKRDYTRFNYIGEWHSHPSFEPLPSEQDHNSMYEIVSDVSVGANFAILVIVKLNTSAELVGTAHTYLPNGQVMQSVLILQR